MLIKYQMDVFWDCEYQKLNYVNEQFNDVDSLAQWRSQGYTVQFTGDMCDMRSQQPSWNNQFVEHFAQLGWNNIGTSYYRMSTGTVLPVHSDTYKKYISLFNLQGRQHTIKRAIVFLEDWQSGHYFEASGVAMTDWRAGQVVEWAYDTPHMAANIGLQDRYTLQITGHTND